MPLVGVEDACERLRDRALSAVRILDKVYLYDLSRNGRQAVGDAHAWTDQGNYGCLKHYAQSKLHRELDVQFSARNQRYARPALLQHRQQLLAYILFPLLVVCFIPKLRHSSPQRQLEGKRFLPNAIRPAYKQGLTLPVRYLSLFSGVGGFELGIAAAGLELGMDFECVGYAETDKWAIQTYEQHFSHRALGDVQEIEPATLPGFELLVAGFPCQPFSTAGGRLGFDDTRGTLFFDIARILQHSRPRHFILENVTGLLSHESGETFKTIIGVLTGLGYGCVEWQILDSQDYGLPTSRQRVFIVGHLGGIPKRPVFPLGVNVGRKVDGDPKRSRYGERVFRPEIPDTDWFGCVRDRIDGTDVWSSRAIATTIDANYGSGPGYMGNRLSIARVENGVLKARRMTPLEIERVQGFPDDWTAGRSDTQRYRQMGNAVVPNVVAAVATELYRST